MTDMYMPREVRRIIARYQELRSTVEIAARRFDRGHSGQDCTVRRSEEILCLLLDIDRAAQTLTPRQRQVVILAQSGCTPEDISDFLDISVSAAKFHFHHAISRMTTCLNEQ